MKPKPLHTNCNTVAQCPTCGNHVSFLAYRTETQAVHIHQTAPGEWSEMGRSPKRLNAIAVTHFVCESCAHPLGQPPLDVIELVLTPKKRRRN